MHEILSLEPHKVWKYFSEITQIPRPSKHEEKIIEYLKLFAVNHNLECKTDETGNVLIVKPASLGMDSRPAIAMQAHMDMVCEKNGDVEFDFLKDSIRAYVENDFVKARGTTLGGDNGIGMAMMLAILASDDIVHPAIECLFTVDEETGLTGAFALGKDFFESKTLINLDSEDDGVIFIGCAGGVDTTAGFAFEMEQSPAGYFSFKVKVAGLKGGHSGDDINKGLGNANKILNRYLWALNRDTDLRIGHIDGGNLRNAIAREAEAVVMVPYEKKEFVRVELNCFISDIENEFKKTEPQLHISLESCDTPPLILPKSISDRLLNAIYACPHGVVAMSADMPGLVETSTNLASVKIKNNNCLVVTTSQRSSVESSKYDIANQVESVFLLAGAEVTHGDGYPGWQPDLSSKILNVAENAYQHLYAEKPVVRAIHAGLECGLFLKKYPGLDMISIGPQMYGVHSPDERLSISSTQKCWNWLLEILKQA